MKKRFILTEKCPNGKISKDNLLLFLLNINAINIDFRINTNVIFIKLTLDGRINNKKILKEIQSYFHQMVNSDFDYIFIDFVKKIINTQNIKQFFVQWIS